MTCDRCGRQIQTGEKFTRYTKTSASGVGITVTLHGRLCKKPPTQTYPSRPSR